MSNLPCAKQAIIDVIVFVSIIVPYLVVFALGEPVVSGFWCRDQSLRLPYKADSVPKSLLLVFTFGGSFITMLLTESIRAAAITRQLKRFRWELFSLLKGYGIFLFGLAANCLVTDGLKFSVGRHRPHFIDICKPNFDTINCTTDALEKDRFVMDYECTNTEVDDKLLRDSRLSFPSGHASLSVYCAVFTILYLQLRMNLSVSHLLRPTIQLGVAMLAILCCVSRVTDHKHFASDVLAGAVLGCTIAILTFLKLGRRLIPTSEPEPPTCKAKAARLQSTISYESEPQTPTPLLQPERLVLSQSNHSFRGGNVTSVLKHANNV